MVSFKAHLSSLRPMLRWVRVRLKMSGFSDVEIRRIELAIEEALVNIISYAYRTTDERPIDLEYHLEPGKYITLTIRDRGLPFNLLKYKREGRVAVTPQEEKRGGLGILFIQKIIDNIEYVRVQKMNILKLTKFLPKDKKTDRHQ